MAEIGVRDLKATLSACLRRVKQGETIVVTERGAPIARIVPFGVPEHLAGLIAAGKVRWSGEAFVVPREPFRVAPGPALSEYVGEDRR